MKKLTTLLLAALMLLGTLPALASSAPDWTEYNALIAQIKTTTDFVEREALMHRAEDILMDTGAICPIYYYNDHYLLRTGVEGFYMNVYNTQFFQKVSYGDNTALRIMLASEPDKLDPALNSSVDGATLAANSFGGLYTYDETGATVPNFATGYTMSEDGLTYVFTMREGLKWSDGSPLTAKDFEYSWKRAIASETAADYAYMYSGFAGYDEGDLQVAASEDGKTLTVNLTAPCAYMLDLMAFPTFFAVKQECVESAEGYKDAAGKVVSPGAWALEAGFPCSGPFMLESWDHNVSMTYVKNPNYWDAENVKLEKLEVMLSDDDVAVFAAYQAGDLDFVNQHVPVDEIAGMEGNPEFYLEDILGTYYVIFNVKSELFDGMTVTQAAAMRKGLSALIDRQYIIDTVVQTGNAIATSFIPAGMMDGHGGVFKTNDADYTFPVGDGYFKEEPDVDAAIALLTEAGFKFENGMLSAETPLSFEYLTNNTTNHIAIGECMQQDFAQVGINMTIKAIDWGVFLNERKEGNFGIARNGWVADFNDPINMLEMWITESGNNDAQFGR